MRLRATASDPVGGPEDVFPRNRNIVFTNYGRTAFEKVLQLEDLAGATVAFPALLWKESFRYLIAEYDIDPVFFDVDPDSYHLDPDAVERRIGDLDAVVLNHTFGVPAAARRWQSIASGRDVVLIEDCARGLGAKVDGRPIGSFGKHAIYSLKKVTPTVRGSALATTVDPARIDLGRPAPDVKDVHPLFPDRVLGWLVGLRDRLGGGEAPAVADGVGEEYYPLAPEVRELDRVNRAVFRYFLHRKFGRQLERNAALAGRLRRQLADLGVAFQATRGTCPHHFLAMTVPHGRDEIARRLRAADVPVRTLWRAPLVTSFVDETDLAAFPNTVTVMDDGLQFSLAEMSDADVRAAVEIVRRTIEDRPSRPTSER